METSCATSGTSGHKMEVQCKMKWQSRRMPDLIYENKIIDLMAVRVVSCEPVSGCRLPVYREEQGIFGIFGRGEALSAAVTP
jgi:hypothetical protein